MKNYSLLTLNHAFQCAIRWGGIQWILRKKDLEEIRSFLKEDNDPKELGSLLWHWFNKKYNNSFITDKPMEEIGSEFIEALEVFNETEDSALDLNNVTRVEVIDKNGRSYVNWRENNQVSYSLQDSERTLKIFIKEQTKEVFNDARAKIIDFIQKLEI